MNNDKLIKKYFKTFLDAKEKINTNNEIAYDKFKESLSILDNIKKNGINEEHKKLIEETETECYKYIGLTIESSIETENNNKIIYDNNLLIKFIEKGELEEMKKAKYGEIKFDNNILHYAIRYGDVGFLTLAFKLGARIDMVNENGHTLLEYACLEHNADLINIIIKYGANMQKHLYFREGNKNFQISNNSSIDILIILKIILSYLDIKLDNKKLDKKIYNKINIIKNSLDLKQKIGFNDYSIEDLINSISIFLNNINEETAITYLNIIIEEISYNIKNKLGCPQNKLELILINLVPFIDNYPFNISIDYVVSLELKYLIIKLIKNKKKLDILNIKKELIDEIWNSYIINNILTEDYIGILISQWISKIKV
jgi:hypothetical protein